MTPNTFYLSAKFPIAFPRIYADLVKEAEKLHIPVKLLSNTRDIWAKDFMPCQVSPSDFVQFVYNPVYLRNTQKGRRSITTVDEVIETLSIAPRRSSLLFEGGNLSRFGSQAIVCDRIFEENPTLSEEAVISELLDALQLDKLTVVPSHKHDFTGHSDGMLRLISPHEVLINDYSREDRSFQYVFRSALRNAGYSLVTIPYNPYQNSSYDSAVGEYLNYLDFDQGILFPVFGLPEDAAALKRIQWVYPNKEVRPIDCRELALLGGALNCVGWNIFQPE